MSSFFTGGSADTAWADRPRRVAGVLSGARPLARATEQENARCPWNTNSRAIGGPLGAQHVARAPSRTRSDRGLGGIELRT